MRVALAVVGVAAIGWGAYLLLEAAPHGLSTLVWLVAGPLVTDGLFAPVIGVVAVALARLLPHPARTPVMIGLAVTAVLGLLAIPLLWREFGVRPQPGLHAASPVPGLLWTFAAVWVVVAVCGVATGMRRRPD